jgi:uncharacterized protein (DUF433 family)
VPQHTIEWKADGVLKHTLRLGQLMAAQIESNPRIMMGKPTIAGTRITVESIIERVTAGESIAQILQAHRHLTEDQVRAALEFARRTQ